ncbi:ABC transporter ATP-binding protein [Gordonia sp. NPDC003425]
MTMLECRGLHAGHGRTNPCVRDVDLDIDEGEVVTILGPNGAGKTTLLETIAGFLARVSGRVAIGGADLKSGDPRAAVRAGFVLVPDDRALFRNLTVEQNLRLAVHARRRGASAAAVDEAVHRFPALGDRRKVKAGALSGGEQQMLAISRALVQHPKVLAIDELSMGLAPVVVESILTVLREVATDAGMSVLLVEQHVRLALEVADRALVLVHGEIRMRADAAELAADVSRVENAYLGA